jgi:hypothetical protein
MPGMNFRCETCFAVLLLCVGGLRSQVPSGFDHFPRLDTSTYFEQSLSAEQLFDQYLKQLNFQLPVQKQAIILIPESGCPYCVQKMVNFYKAHHRDSGLHLILAGNSNILSEYSADKIPFTDLANNCKKYGFDSGFPVVALLEAYNTVKLVRIESQRIDEQLKSVLAFIEQ